MSEVAIQVENLTKTFRIGSRAPYFRFSEVLMNLGKATLQSPGRFWSGSSPPSDSHTTNHFDALRDVSFTVDQGEIVGIIGGNGAGKSTLLKILSRITEPTAGRFGIRGRVGSLLEVGTGFHPELTGRENIFLSGTILGMSQAAIRSHFDEIAAFAEVGEFLDTPVKRYSSGMYVRLGFAIAAHLDPEVLIVDEVLAVGDIAFQKKCLGRMGQVAASGRTVLFVSHNMAAVQSLCTRAILLQNGQTAGMGDTTEVIQQYRRSVATDDETSLIDRSDRTGTGKLRFATIQCTSLEGDHETGTPPACGGPARFILRLQGASDQTARNVVVGIAITDSYGNLISSLVNRHQGLEFPSVDARATIQCDVHSLPLTPGAYGINLVLISDRNIVDKIDRAGQFQVVDNDVFGTGRLPDARKHGSLVLSSRWRIDEDGRRFGSAREMTE
jgi:lipopolysaccharide transport system ATP-binding protein